MRLALGIQSSRWRWQGLLTPLPIRKSTPYKNSKLGDSKIGPLMKMFPISFPTDYAKRYPFGIVSSQRRFR